MAKRTRHLHRSREDRMLGGVCGGMAEYFNVDSSFIRLLWILFILLTGGIGLLLYLAAWIVIPATPRQ